MCIMGNDNDPPTSSWEFPDENINSTNSGYLMCIVSYSQLCINFMHVYCSNNFIKISYIASYIIASSYSQLCVINTTIQLYTYIQATLICLSLKHGSVKRERAISPYGVISKCMHPCSSHVCMYSYIHSYVAYLTKGFNHVAKG